ncbi:MAG: hypothetical protein HZB26_19385 [Candidatus Hydrogenedentes bacterium]|nr:hypothetical protein [Candidatus Hydrogenedentota bacterium]
MSRRILAIAAALVGLALAAFGAHAQKQSSLDLSQAVVVAPSADPVVATAATMLREEIEKRSGVKLRQSSTRVDGPAIVLGVEGTLVSGYALAQGQAGPPKLADGFAVHSGDAKSPVFVIGHDPRGALFGVGRLIRMLDLKKDYVALKNNAHVVTAPKYRVRGHQIGYREAANTYDLWTLDTYEQYIRDMALFGTNTVELITSLDPAFKEGKVMQRNQWDMNVDLTKLLKKYGMDVCFWMPLDGDVRDPKVAQQELDDRAKFFAACAEINDIMVPGGDPGRTHPQDLMPWLEKMAAVLHERFPKAGVWVSNQKFSPEENDAFFAYIRDKQPAWLRGIVHGPSTPGTVQENRDRLPKQYMLRTYPDITHSLRCQFPVPSWDRLFAQTLDREAPNPRPQDEAVIARVTSRGSDGFVSYSDGSQDDLNKMLWSALAWDPDAKVEDILEDYGRVFFGVDVAKDAGRGLQMLEDNWRGDALRNRGINKTLALWERVGAKSGERLADNWRYNMYLMRAIYDKYVRVRGTAELSYEKEAYAALKRAPKTGAVEAIKSARAALAKTDTEKPGVALRQRLVNLGPKLLKEIGYQLSMDPPYLAKSPERGAILDKLDRPLNDRLWLETQFTKILAEKESKTQLAQLNTIVNWENPGAGGFYDDLGRAGHEPHLKGQLPYEQDPGFLRSPHDAYFRSMNNNTKEIEPLKYSWMDCSEAGETTPLDLSYQGLDPKAQYRVRVTYYSRYRAEMKLVADGKYEVHGPLKQPDPVWPVEYDVPKAATADGRLDLQWQLVSGRGVQVAEVWLLKKAL